MIENEKLKILLVDDDIDEKVHFRWALQQLDLPHRLLWAKSCEELFEILEKEPGLHLVVLDINMPGVNGKQCLKLLKAHNDYKSLPVIVMSVSKDDRDIDEVFGDGAHHYVVKPYSLLNYTETLKRIFRCDWMSPQPVPSRDRFLINFAFA